MRVLNYPRRHYVLTAEKRTIKDRSYDLYEKNYEGKGRWQIFKKALANFIRTCGFGLRKETNRERWIAVFKGRKVIAVPSSVNASRTSPSFTRIRTSKEERKQTSTDSSIAGTSQPKQISSYSSIASTSQPKQTFTDSSIAGTSQPKQTSTYSPFAGTSQPQQTSIYSNAGTSQTTQISTVSSSSPPDTTKAYYFLPIADEVFHTFMSGYFPKCTGINDLSFINEEDTVIYAFTLLSRTDHSPSAHQNLSRIREKTKKVILLALTLEGADMAAQSSDYIENSLKEMGILKDSDRFIKHSYKIPSNDGVNPDPPPTLLNPAQLRVDLEAAMRN